MKSRDVHEAAGEFAPEVERLIDSLGINREQFDVRVNRCEGKQGELSDDIYHIWVGVRGFAPRNNIGEIIEGQHTRWKDGGWTITRYRHLEGGGINLAATDPDTGNSYALDSGFDKGPDSYVVGFFNTPCYQSPSGKVDFGPVDSKAGNR